MAYWIGEFTSLENHHYTVKIGDPHITEDKHFVFGTGAVRLRYDRGENKYAPLKSIMATLDIVTDEDMTTLYSDSPFQNPVTIEDENGTLWYSGWLIPSEWDNDARPGNRHITLNAADAVGMLKYRKIRNDYRQVAPIRDLWQNIMTDMGVTDYECNLSAQEDVSTEVCIPINHDEPYHSDAWKSYSDIIDAIGQYAHKTTMVWQGKAYAVNPDEYLPNDYWQSSADQSAENNLAGDSFRVEITPAYSHFSFKPAGGEKVYINDIFGRITPKKCQIGKEEKLSTISDTQHCFLRYATPDNSPSLDTNILPYAGGSSNLLLIKSWSGDKVDNESDATPVIARTIAMKPEARHTVFRGQGLFIKVLLSINEPLPWGVSDLEATEQTFSQEQRGNIVAGSHFGIKINGNLVYPAQVEFDRPDNVTGFYEVTYSFVQLPEGGLMEPVIIPQGTDITYIKSIKVIGGLPTKVSSYDSEFEIVEDITNDFDRLMAFEMPIFYGESGKYTSVDYSSFVYAGINSLTPKKTSIINQYRHPRRLYTATLPLDGFTPFHKVKIGQYKCTIDGATIDLRNDTVTASLLESGN